MARTNLIPMALEAPRRSQPDFSPGRRELVDAILQQSVGKPVHSIPEGLARMGTMALAGWMEKRDKGERASIREQLVDSLLSGDSEGSMRALLTSDDDAARSLGFDLYKQRFAAPKERSPIRLGQNDVLLDPDTYEPIWQPQPEPPRDILEEEAIKAEGKRLGEFRADLPNDMAASESILSQHRCRPQ